MELPNKRLLFLLGGVNSEARKKDDSVIGDEKGKITTVTFL